MCATFRLTLIFLFSGKLAMIILSDVSEYMRGRKNYG